MPFVLMVLGFMWWWPLGLVLLGFLIARGRFGYWRHPMVAGDGAMLDWESRWERKAGRLESRWEREAGRLQEKMERKMERIRSRMDRVRGVGDFFSPASSGNHAFDDYRAETLKRLEDEQREFKDFLARLRFAKDRAEFDQFMADRRQRPSEPDSPEPPPADPRN